MTAQLPDKLVIEAPEVDLAGLHLYGVVLGPVDPADPDRDWGSGLYPLPLPGAADLKSLPTCLWRGYVATFFLAAGGSLELKSYTRWEAPAPTDVHLQLDGDFWLVLSPGYGRLKTYVPFRNGSIVRDRRLWLHETPEAVRARQNALRARRRRRTG